MKKQKQNELPDQACDRIPRVTLTLTDETIWLTRHDPRGRPAATYPVSSSDVGRAFSGFTSTTGLLPPDTLFVGTRNGRTRIGVWLPPARREIRYAHGRKTARLTVPMPGLVFVGEGAAYWVWAALSRPQTDKDRLYSAPLPNVHQDGAICQGSAKLPVCAPGSVGAAVALFFESEFNGDLSYQRIRREGNLLEFLRSIERARRFPSRQLIEVGSMQSAIDGTDNDRVWMPTDAPALVTDEDEMEQQEGDFV